MNKMPRFFFFSLFFILIMFGACTDPGPCGGAYCQKGFECDAGKCLPVDVEDTDSIEADTDTGTEEEDTASEDPDPVDEQDTDEEDSFEPEELEHPVCEPECGSQQICNEEGCTCVVGFDDCDNEPENGCEVWLAQDSEHCGDCPTVCGFGQFCTGGECVCPDGLESCSESCVNLQTDWANCGECGVVCNFGEVCTGGSCKCGEGEGCGEEESCCGNPPVCVSEDAPICTCGTVACMAAQLCCFVEVEEGDFHDTCISVDHDPLHCGSCDVQCGIGQVCINSTCECQPGFLDCEGSGNSCSTNPDSDVEHCGECSHACEPGEVCSQSECQLICQGGFEDCGGSCINLQTDRTHCGECGNACEVGMVCASGECVLSCQDGLDDCSGNCVNLQSDRTHCGDCGNVCDTGNVCSLGECELICQEGLENCGDNCVNVQTARIHCGECGEICESGEVCSSGECVLLCSPGLNNCDGNCVNLQTNLNYCGACNDTCNPGMVCSSGECAHNCQEGFTDCERSCVNLQRDRTHCGGCESACENGNVCSLGECVVSCHTSLSDCGGNCVNLQSDRTHCGDCGNVCDTGNVCSLGECELSCQDDLSDCGGDCVDVVSDRHYCGHCNNPCSSSEECVDGECVVWCPEDLTGCSGNCVNLQTDRSNCRVCGNVCSSGEVCAEGVCELICHDGLDNCNNWCVNLQSDLANCGECGAGCGSGQVCVEGECQLFCSEAQEVCDNSCVNIQNDRTHCGVCGNQCGDFQICLDAQCTSHRTDCGHIGGGCDYGETCSDDHLCCLNDRCYSPTMSITGGSFWMGCNEEDCTNITQALPYHEVDVPEFEIDLTEVTLGQYRACVEDNENCSEPSTKDPSTVGLEYCNWGTDDREEHPVNCIDWYQARNYCDWTGKRLCSESEWEKAARGTDGRIYPWGDDVPDCNRAVNSGCPGDTYPVGFRPAGVYGLYDMAGNVWEWLEDDWHDSYDDDDVPDDGTPWIDSPRAFERVKHGGAFTSLGRYLRSFFRNSNEPDFVYNYMGVRCCRSICSNDSNCHEFRSCCNGTCVDLTSSNRNCGECGYECSAGATCVDSVCICGVLGGICGEEETCEDGLCCSDNRCSAPMATIPAGPFMMGCDREQYVCPSNELPYHEVNVPEFEIDVTEVTQRAYRACVDDNENCSEPSTEGVEYCNWGTDDREEHPVNCIDWDQARNYCDWAGKRLCSESEWEKAARGIDGRIYPWGNTEATCDWAVMHRDEVNGCGEDRTWPVGSKPAGMYGLYDMAGNVWEVVEDDYHSTYNDAPDDGEPWIENPRGSVHIRRGGSFLSVVSSSLRASIRSHFSSGSNGGVRCCRDAP